MSTTASLNCSGSSVAGPSSSVGSLALSSSTSAPAASTSLQPIDTEQSPRAAWQDSLESLAKFCANPPYLAWDWPDSTVCADEEVHLQSRKRKRVSLDEWRPTARTKRSRLHRSQHDQLQLNVLHKLLVAFQQSDTLTIRASQLADDVHAVSDATRACARSYADADAQRAKYAGPLRFLDDAYALKDRAVQGMQKLQEDADRATESNTSASLKWAATTQMQIDSMHDWCRRSEKLLQRAGDRSILRGHVQMWANMSRSAAEQHHRLIQRGRGLARGFEAMEERAHKLSCKQEESILDLIILWKAAKQAA